MRSLIALLLACRVTEESAQANDCQSSDETRERQRKWHVIEHRAVDAAAGKPSSECNETVRK